MHFHPTDKYDIYPKEQLKRNTLLIWQTFMNFLYAWFFMVYATESKCHLLQSF